MPATATREALPDRLRGFALLGIVVVNAAFLGISGDGFTQDSSAMVERPMAPRADLATTDRGEHVGTRLARWPGLLA